MQPNTAPAPLVAALRRAGVCAATTLLLCASAQAQAVRKCHVDGKLVFQSSPCALDAPAATAAVAAPMVAAVDPNAPPKKKTLADILRERDQSDAPPARKREFQSDGANVLRARMGAI